MRTDPSTTASSDDTTTRPPDDEEARKLDELLKLVRAHENERHRRPNSPAIVSKRLLGVYGALVVVMFGVVIYQQQIAPHPVPAVGLIGLGAYLAMLATMIWHVAAVQGAYALKLLRSPWNEMFPDIHAEIMRDAELLARTRVFDKSTRTFAAHGFERSAEGLQNRLRWLIGPIDSTGLLAGLLGLWSAIEGMMKAHGLHWGLFAIVAIMIAVAGPLAFHIRDTLQRCAAVLTHEVERLQPGGLDTGATCTASSTAAPVSNRATRVAEQHGDSSVEA